MITLRPYQIECLNQIKKLHTQGNHRLLVSLPTAAGKSVIFSQLIKDQNQRCLIIAHTHELLYQAAENIRIIAPNLNIGLIDSNHKDFDSHIVIASVQSACIDSNLDQLMKQNFNILIYDECHHAATDGSRKILDRLGFGKNTNKLLVGFTATAFRSDGKGLGGIFDVVAFERNTKQMIEDGFLCQPEGYKIATDLDLSKVKSIDGDFIQTSLALVMDTPEMNSLVVQSYIKRAYGRQAICFGVNINHANNLAVSFNDQGITAKAVYSDMPIQERNTALRDYQDGKIKVLCNCQVLTEGVNLPETSCVIIARPTRSKGLYIQMVGRGLRLWPNKNNCVVLDFSDRNHSICSTAVLLHDNSHDDRQAKADSKKDILRMLPTKLNPKLKAAIVSHDPLGESFTWQRGDNKAYFMKGAGQARIDLVRYSTDKYSVIYSDEKNSHIIAEGLNFEWAFSTAEDFAKANRKLFVISDKEAEWRKQPISIKQKDALKKWGYRAGIDQLTKGQASELLNALFDKSWR